MKVVLLLVIMSSMAAVPTKSRRPTDPTGKAAVSTHSLDAVSITFLKLAVQISKVSRC